MAETPTWVPVRWQDANPSGVIADFNARLKRCFDVVELRQRTDVQTASASRALILNWPQTFVQVDTTAATVTLTLPPVAICRGFVVDVKKMVAANSVLVDAYGSETVDGISGFTWTDRYQNMTFICNGTAWVIK